MKKDNLTMYVLCLIASIALSIVYYSGARPERFSEELFWIMTCLATFSIGGLYEYWQENRKTLWVNFKCITFLRRSEIYVSLSYLLKIKVDGPNKYLVVKGSKIPHQYQPVGGVYERYPSSENLFQNWEARPARDKMDLRFFVKAVHIPDVLKWFETQKNREIDVWREFQEELIESSILPAKDFRHIKAEFLYRCPEYLIRRKGFRQRQVVIYDIYHIHINEQQTELLKEILINNPHSDEYSFVDEDDLDIGCFDYNGTEYSLGGHAKYLKSKS
jgi:hypothetical protein